jgi:nucleotide-binding universal stress UspA family protein
VSSIVVGFIFTKEGFAAVDAAIAEATRRQAKLVVVHSMLGGSHEADEEYIESATAVEDLRARLEGIGIDFCTHEFVRGNSPSTDLMDAVVEHDAELMVIGIRRRSTVGKVLLGSNALEILHDATVPVLCVKALD